MQKETIEYDGVVWTRYPEAKGRSEREYFQRGKKRLHIYIWEKNNGPVSKGFHIHHKDGDCGNNAIENLEILLQKKHRQIHMQQAWIHTSEGKEHTNRIRPLTKEWHGSAEGIEWHRKHANKHWWESPVINTKRCIICNKEFETIKKSNFKFCSNNCKSAHRRQSKKDNIKSLCQCCGIEFEHDKYHPRICCNRKCATTLYWQKSRL